ncbi:MAG TPA: hypothetical protein VMV10_13940 [Pirellulales bacterium]|nr:hypothetical protein [Pirellulales bacterium]
MSADPSVENCGPIGRPANDVTREGIIAALQQLVRQQGRPISRAKFVGLTGINPHFISAHFPGGWKEAEEAAGAPKSPGFRPRASEDELLRAFHKAASELGAIPTRVQLRARGAPALWTFNKRFGTLPQILDRYEAWLEERDPDSPLLAQLRDRNKIGHRMRGRPPRRQRAAAEWPRSDGFEYGAPLDFRGLRHEPTSELGVIYLFGMLSEQLGMVVEALQPGFPDCEAKRCVDLGRDRWQRVRIEFEFLSRNFRDHGHDPAGCELIVCWRHDWPECPLEVIELRSVVAQRMGAAAKGRESAANPASVSG